MFKFLFLVFTITASLALAQNGPEEFTADETRDDSALEVGVDFAQQDPFMSELYQKGAYLIYDCVSQHWVCTGKEEYNGCVRWRRRALNERESNLSCAYFVPFDSRKDCQKKQVELTDAAVGNRFCMHPLVRENRMYTE